MMSPTESATGSVSIWIIATYSCQYSQHRVRFYWQSGSTVNVTDWVQADGWIYIHHSPCLEEDT